MDRKLFDTEQIRRRNGQPSAAPVRAELTRRLEERLGEVKGKGERVLRVRAEDVPPETGGYGAVLGDMVLPLVEDVPVFMVRCLQQLDDDGLLLMSTLGTESFREFRDAWAEIGEAGGHVVPLTDVREGGALLQRLKLALPVVDRDVMTITFPDFASLYASLRAHGVGNFYSGRRQGLVTPRKLRAMEEAYVRLFPRADGRIPVTLEVVYLHGFKVGEGQPTSAKRGSGKVSLVRIFEGSESDNN
jgi:malonyl-CoA O-methyltransferase